MLLKRACLDAIVRGDVTLAFRRWQRPTVKAGGTLKTTVGVLAIDAVDVVAPAGITAADARQAGFADRAALMAELGTRDGDTYRIALRYLGADPRIALRQQAKLSAADRAALRARLDRFDQLSKLGPWTGRVLDRIAKEPAILASKLARALGYETAWFKTNVRKLKALGLTESMEVGYRLSPRGRAFLRP
jgi:hypothetical protein